MEVNWAKGVGGVGRYLGRERECVCVCVCEWSEESRN
jgi:hypothetical protein